MTGNDDDAFEILNAGGTGPAVVVCEHASNHIPAVYHGLGLSAQARQSHAAWDPGAEAVARRVAQAMDAPLVAGRISRLVHDCNRPPGTPGAMPDRVETIDVPGNAGLDATERAARARRVHAPFSRALADLLDRRRETGHRFALVTVHSFTPAWLGRRRDVEIGILHDDDPRLADAMLARAGDLPARRIERNAPYGPADGVTHTLRAHGVAGGLPNVMIELRNDLLRTPQDRARIAQELLSLLRPALHEASPFPQSAARGTHA